MSFDWTKVWILLWFFVYFWNAWICYSCLQIISILHIDGMMKISEWNSVASVNYHWYERIIGLSKRFVYQKSKQNLSKSSHSISLIVAIFMAFVRHFMFDTSVKCSFWCAQYSILFKNTSVCMYSITCITKLQTFLPSIFQSIHHYCPLNTICRFEVIRWFAWNFLWSCYKKTYV